jgi:predicted transposase YdaD
VRDSDSLYHRLFSHPPMVEALVREFVPEALAAGLDFSRLQRVNPKFHFRRRSGRKREGDVIWRLPTREGREIYLYLLMEFQSESDWWMAVRAQVYTGLLWQQVIEEKELKTGARLPPLVLLVLYNGAPEWKAPMGTGELIALSADSPLWPWQPQVRYYLLNIDALPKDDLARRTNLAALLFRLDQPHSNPQELESLLAEVIGWFREHEGYERLRELFTELVRDVFAGLGRPVPKVEDMLQMKTRISTLGQVWKQQWKAEGLAEGRAEGRVEGRLEGRAKGHAEGRAEGHAEGCAEGEAKGLVRGKADALVCLLTERFGDVKPSIRRRIDGAQLPTIEQWFKRAVVAPDLLSVFARSRY